MRSTISADGDLRATVCDMEDFPEPGGVYLYSLKPRDNAVVHMNILSGGNTLRR